MNRNQFERNKSLNSPIPGCLGRMVNLFDLNASLGGNRLLTDNPHYEGSPLSRSQSNVSRSRVVDGRMHDKPMVSELAKSGSNRKLNGTPIKMLIAQEMLKEEVPKQSPPNLVAKLMGLDDLPQQHQLGSASCRSSSRRSRSRSHSGSLDFMQKEHDEVNQYKDVFEIWQQSCKTYDVSPQKAPQKGRKCKESKNEKSLAFVREKFIEAKRLSTDEKLRQTKQFQDALEVLSSNKDLFLQLLQEPNSLFSKHQNLPSVPPLPDSKCITVLKPSKLSDAHKLPSSGKKNGKQVNGIVWDKYDGNPNKPNQPTRIVVLKPSTGKAKKRLSERWAMMSLNGNVQEQRHVRRSSSTLGEMLALSDIKRSVESEENCKNTSNLNINKCQDADIDIDRSPKSLMRSKSLPVSSTDFLKGKKDDDKELTKEKSHKSSLFKGKVSSLFFSKSRKSSKQKSQKSDDDTHQSSRNIGNDGSQCVSDVVVKGVDAELASQHLPEGVFSGNANENQEQPSPISVLELPFEDDDHTSGYSRTAKLNDHGDSNKCNLIGKSPLIGSIARTLSFDDSDVGTVSPVLGETSTKPLSREEEEQECLLYVQTLLSASGINGEVQSDTVIARWHSPESPLDPSLRDKYMNQTDKVVDQSKQRHQRFFQKLVFDAVNEALIGGTHKDHVWGQMKEWLSGDERCVWDGDEEDGGGTITPLAVEWVVRKEVAGQVWTKCLKVQIDDISKEIEEKVVEQLVEELVLE
ncbi:hypothetical protein HanRHA438_Chr04g0179361 [Helianthus annuus]|nr:hypothetical protein HanRHA438_Chr04g0179361 [Helianthus annuus]